MHTYDNNKSYKVNENINWKTESWIESNHCFSQYTQINWGTLHKMTREDLTPLMH